MKKRFRRLALLSLSVIALVGCNSNGEVKEDKDSKIVVYSNSLTDGRGDFLNEKATSAGFDIELVDIGGSDLLNRIIAEKDAPIADVVFGLNQMMFSTIESEGILESYEPNWLDKVEPSLRNKDSMFSPLQEQRVLMIYDADKIAENEVVSKWEDLWADPQLHERYIVPGALGSATKNAVVYNILMNYQAENGDMGTSDEGWKAIEQYCKNGVIPTEGQTEAAELVNGVVDYSFTWLSNIPIVEESFGINIGVVNPTYGVPQTVEQVGIVKKNKENQNVQAFVDFLGSSELQAEWAEKFGSVPVNEDAKGAINSRVLDVLENTTPQDNDYDFINKYMDEWAEYIELNILG